MRGHCWLPPTKSTLLVVDGRATFSKTYIHTKAHVLIHPICNTFTIHNPCTTIPIPNIHTLTSRHITHTNLYPCACMHACTAYDVHTYPHNYKHSYTFVYIHIYEYKYAQHILHCRYSHVLCLLASHKGIGGMAPCHERRKAQSSETKGCVYEEHLGSQRLEAQDYWRGKSRWCFEYRCSRQGDRMTKVPYTRHPSHTMSQGMNLLPFLPYSPFPSESLEKKEQIT